VAVAFLTFPTNPLVQKILPGTSLFYPEKKVLKHFHNYWML